MAANACASARIDDVGGGKDLLGVGRTDDAEFGLRVHFALHLRVMLYVDV